MYLTSVIYPTRVFSHYQHHACNVGLMLFCLLQVCGYTNGNLEEEDPLAIKHEEDDLIKSIGPDITIIPIKKKKPQIKIRLRDVKEITAPRQVKQIPVYKSLTRSPRTPVRLVSGTEASTVGETYPHRKSLPLEKCPICMKFFRRMKTHLMKHEMVMSDPEHPLVCTFCNKAFNSQSNLQIHMRTHTGDRPYICEVCKKGFAQSCNLVNHMRVHTGEKPFKCPHCDRAFTQSGMLFLLALFLSKIFFIYWY